MKRYFLLAMIALTMVQGAVAQQAQEQRRTNFPMAFKQWRKANIEFALGNNGTAMANIFLKDASLIYLKDSVPMKANLFNVVSVDFGDSVYRKTGDNMMGLVIASQGDAILTKVTMIDMHAVQKEKETGVNSKFLDLPEFNVFIDTNSDYAGADEIGSMPLADDYYFIVKGVTFPASEKIVKKHIRSEKRADFKELMKNRKWSWRDAKSLEVLLSYF